MLKLFATFLINFKLLSTPETIQKDKTSSKVKTRNTLNVITIPFCNPCMFLTQLVIFDTVCFGHSFVLFSWDDGE